MTLIYIYDTNSTRPWTFLSSDKEVHDKTDVSSNLPFHSDAVTYQTAAGHIMYPSTCTKDDGVHMSSDYSWGEHIGEIITNANRNATWALAIIKDRSRDVMLPLYTSFIRNHLQFCCPLWKRHDIGSIQRLENMKKIHQTSSWPSVTRLLTGSLTGITKFDVTTAPSGALQNYPRSY